MNNENKGIHPTGVSSRVWIALVVLFVANVVAHLMVMPSLPAQIPMHWGATIPPWGECPCFRYSSLSPSVFVKPINQPIKSCMTVVFKLYTMF